MTVACVIRWASWAALLLSTALSATDRTGAASSPPSPFDNFWSQSTTHDFATWTMNGVGVYSANSVADVRLKPQPGASFQCSTLDVDGGSAHPDAKVGLCSGRDPKPRYNARAGSYYNGGTFLFGSLISPIHRLPRPMDHVIVSWNASTPPDTWLEIHLRFREAAGWTHFYALPVWASGINDIHRHSVDGQHDANGGVATDTAYTAPGRSAVAYQLRITFFSADGRNSPDLRLLTAVASHDEDPIAAVSADRRTWGKDLPVPQRSQMLPQYRGERFGGGGEAWCSPTSTSMVLAYWARILGRPDLSRTVPSTAAATYDYTYDGAGNWPFNTAYAASFGLHAFVTRFDSLSRLEPWIEAGVPIVISIAFRQGELPGEPVGVSDGHLIVVRGFDRHGDVITNDPVASSDNDVRIVYSRAALQKVWLNGSHGTAYVIYPPGWRIPSIEGAA